MSNVFKDFEYNMPVLNNTPLNIDSKKLLAKAEEFYIKEEYDIALALIEKDTNHMNNYDFLFLKGNIYLNENNPNSNFEIAKGIFLTLDYLDNKPTIKYILGIINFTFQDYERAIAYFRDSVNHDLKNVTYRKGFINCLIKSGNYQEAYKESYEAISLSPNDYELLEAIGYLEYKIKHLDKAILYFTKAHAVGPKNYQNLYNLSFCCLLKENYDSAIKWIEEGLLIEPESEKLLKMYMIACLSTDKWSELEKIALRIIFNNKDSASAVSCLCTSLEKQQKYKQLVNILENILFQIKEKNKKLNKVKSNNIVKKIQKKIFTLQKEILYVNSKEILTTTNKSSTRSYVRNSVYNKFFESGFHAKAGNEELELVEKAVKLKPESPILLFKLGNMFLDTNKNQQALESFIKITKINNNFMPSKVHERIGDSYFKMNDSFNALNHFKKSINIINEMLEDPEGYQKMIEENLAENSRKASLVLRKSTNWDDNIENNLRNNNNNKDNNIITERDQKEIENYESKVLESEYYVKEDNLKHETINSNIVENSLDKIENNKKEENIMQIDLSKVQKNKESLENNAILASELIESAKKRTRNDTTRMSIVLGEVLINEVKNNSQQILETLYTKIGRCYENINQLDEALKFYTKSIEINPLSLWGNFHYGTLTIKLAEKKFEEEVIKLHKQNKQSHKKAKLLSKNSKTIDPESENNTSDDDVSPEIVSRIKSTNHQCNKDLLEARKRGMQYIEESWKINSSLKEIYSRYVIELVNLELYQKAIEIYQSYSSKYPVVIDALVATARAYDKEGNPELALELLEEANHYSEFNEFPDKLFNLALIYEKLKMFNKAILTYKNVLSLNPNHFDSLVNLGIILYDSKEYMRSLKYLKYAHKTRPKSTLIFYYLGKLFKEVNDTESSLFNLNKCLEIDPTYYHAYVTLGDIFLYSDEVKLPKAEKVYRTALKYNSKGVEALTGLGTIHYIQEDFESANQYLEKAYTLNDKDYKVLLAYGNTLVAINNYDLAEQIYIKAIQLGLNSFDVHLSLGNVYLSEGQTDKAIDQFKFAKLDVNNIKPEVYNNLGCAYFNRKNFLDAIKCFKKAIKMRINSDETLYNLGNCYLHSEDYLNAKQIYSDCLNKGMINRDLLYGYLKCIVELNIVEEFDQAEKIIEKLFDEFDVNKKSPKISPSNKGHFADDSKEVDLTKKDKLLRLNTKVDKDSNNNFSIGNVGTNLSQSNKMLFHVRRSSAILQKVNINFENLNELEVFKLQVLELQNKLIHLKQMSNRSELI